MRSSLLAALLFALLAGCAGLDTEDETIGWSAQRLYGEAKDAMAAKDWGKAIKYLEKLTGRTRNAPRPSPPPTASSSSIRIIRMSTTPGT
jgi:outer membrane protein assembly factor BamD (BamD/ComL family)